MITAFIGCYDEEQIRTPISGNGKTCGMTGFGKLDSDGGKIVWSNYQTTFSNEVLGMQGMINKIKTDTIDFDLVLLVSEIQNILDSCGSTQIEILFIDNFLRQLRKVGEDKGSVDLYYDNQRFMSLQKRLRIHTTNVLIPYKTHFDNTPCYSTKCKDKHKIFIYSHKPYVEKEIIIFDASEVGKLYNTYEIVFDILDIPKKKKGDNKNA
jgi:hypothetical protein